jgi:hypothetical protein
MMKRSPNHRTVAAVGTYRTNKRTGGGRATVQVYMPTELFLKARDEALASGRTIAGQFRHMAECYLAANRAGAPQ